MSAPFSKKYQSDKKLDQVISEFDLKELERLSQNQDLLMIKKSGDKLYYKYKNKMKGLEKYLIEIFDDKFKMPEIQNMGLQVKFDYLNFDSLDIYFCDQENKKLVKVMLISVKDRLSMYSFNNNRKIDGYPAEIRKNDINIRVGNLHLNFYPYDKKFKSQEKLQKVIHAVDLKGLSKL